MGLKVFLKSQSASRRYEVEFFRKFASELSQLFELQGYDGVLLGFPTTAKDKFFLPDALIVTTNVLLIVDFKNYGSVNGEKLIVTLPSENRFQLDPWLVRPAIPTTRPAALPPVSSGSSRNRNPFDQLENQSGRLRELLGGVAQGRTVHTCVVFQGDHEVAIEGRIPDRLAGRFSIASRDYLSKIDESLNLRGNGIPLPVETIRNQFDAAPYRDLVNIDISAFHRVAELESLLATATLKAESAQQEILKIRGDIERRGNPDSTAVADLRKKLRLAESRAEEALAAYEMASADRQLDIDNETIRIQAAVEMAKENTKRAREEARKAQAEQRTAETNLALKKEELLSELIEREKSKRSPRRWVTFGAIVLTGLVAATLFFGQNLAKQSAQAPEQCVSPETVLKYEGETICVIFKPLDVRTSGAGKILYLNNDESWSFTVAIENPELVYGEIDHVEKFEGKEVRVTGTVLEKSDGGFKIVVRHASEIEFLD